MDLDNWMLFDIERDATEVHDLAATQPAKLAELVAAFDADAHANYVYPLDNRGVHRSLTVPPFLEDDANRPRTFYPGAGTAALGVVAPLIADRDYRLRCHFSHAANDEGVVFAIGDPLAGMALFVRDRRGTFVYRGGTVDETLLQFDLPNGRIAFELRHDAIGARKGTGTILVDGRIAGTLDMSPTTILGLGVGEGLDIGCDRKLHVTPRYGRVGTFPYTGTVEHVAIEPGTQAPDSYANRRERDAQRGA
jgi:arylsulfatase